MELSTLIESVLGASVVTTSVTYLWTRKKFLSEVKSNDLENLRKMLQIYIDIVEDNKKRLDMYQNDLERVNNRVAMLTDENISLRKEIFALRTENRDLRNQLQNLSLQIIKQTPRK